MNSSFILYFSTTSEAGSSEDKDGPAAVKPSTGDKPAGSGRRKQTKSEDQAPLLPTRTSSRVPKRIRRDISPPTSPCPPKKPGIFTINVATTNKIIV
jgi:hypothetical protein